MESMMIFQNNLFTWLEELRRSLPRQRRLPRNLLLNQRSSLSSSRPIYLNNCRKKIIRGFALLEIFLGTFHANRYFRFYPVAFSNLLAVYASPSLLKAFDGSGIYIYGTLDAQEMISLMLSDPYDWYLPWQ
ncbi:hypothetical protein SAY86_008510 [Trapa natans]|uniref:Uncharacterized protein n=1 Tax=Trapa natans TaxID=22666 RepID=A0AAN7KFI0_TRANT|nr:hypothetical protein SAY86_008510 [Trapa natans]